MDLRVTTRDDFIIMRCDVSCPSLCFLVVARARLGGAGRGGWRIAWCYYCCHLFTRAKKNRVSGQSARGFGSIPPKQKGGGRAGPSPFLFYAPSDPAPASSLSRNLFSQRMSRHDRAAANNLNPSKYPEDHLLPPESPSNPLFG